MPTYTDARKLEKQARLPPQTWLECVSLLTTYYLFLKMLFGTTNSHFQGVGAMKNQLMTMEHIMNILNEMYYTHVCWAIIDNMCTHFSKPTVTDDFQTQRGVIVWPCSGLQQVVAIMATLQPISILTFPDELRQALSYAKRTLP